MKKIDAGSKQAMFRVIDANFNRFKEGLRVTEDIIRFIFEDKKLFIRAKKLRHSLDFILKREIGSKSIRFRDSKKDLGQKADELEIKRNAVGDILIANIQRSKESIRVLEEFAKILDRNSVSKIKEIRYQIYSLEKEALLSYVYNFKKDKKL
ncbi:MAG: thiamine-phosphate pyrophosphorylase [Candidatus Omnitrophota bacterium]